jgi:hypothetical protein
MVENEEIIKKLNLMSTHIHDQIEAVKDDVKNNTKEVETILEISATLEKALHEFKPDEYLTKDFVREFSEIVEIFIRRIQDIFSGLIITQMHTFINYNCLRLYTLAFLRASVEQEDKLRQLDIFNQMLELLSLQDDYMRKTIITSKFEDQADNLDKFYKKYFQIQNEILGSS